MDSSVSIRIERARQDLASWAGVASRSLGLTRRRDLTGWIPQESVMEGSGDLIARAIGDRLVQSWSVPFVASVASGRLALALSVMLRLQHEMSYSLIIFVNKGRTPTDRGGFALGKEIRMEWR